MTTTPQNKPTLAALYALWDQLGDIPTGNTGDLVDCLDQPFLQFAAGTPRETVWHWFESQHPQFIVGDVMQGLRLTEASASEAHRG
jgi:hypothetical protein